MRQSYVNSTVLIISFFALLFDPFSGTTYGMFFFLFFCFAYLFGSSGLRFVQNLRVRQWGIASVYFFVSLAVLVFLALAWERDKGKIDAADTDQLAFLYFVALGHIVAEGFLVGKKKSPSFSTKSTLPLYSFLISFLIAGGYVFVQCFDSKVFLPKYVFQALSVLAASGVFLSTAVFTLIEKRLWTLIRLTDVQLFLSGKKKNTIAWGDLERLQNVKTMVFPKKNFLSDGKYVFQEVNHRATMREQTVLNTFYQLFLYLDETIAKEIEEKLDEAKALIFQDIKIEENALFATDEFGVKYILGDYSVAKKFTQDPSYTYYLIRGNTLFAKILFSDSPNEGLRVWIEAFNFRPMNTVLVSDEPASACEQVVDKLRLDKAYSELNRPAQAELVRRLNAKASTACVSFDQNLVVRTDVGFLLQNNQPEKTAESIWQLFHAAKVFRDEVRNVSYALLPVSIFYAFLVLQFRLLPLYAFGAVFLLHIVVFVFLRTVIVRKIKLGA